MAATPRFLTLADVAEVLSTSPVQVYALVRRGELEAIKIGGRGQWRVEASKLEEFIQRAYEDSRAYVRDHPYAEPAGEPAGGPAGGPAGESAGRASAE